MVVTRALKGPIIECVPNFSEGRRQEVVRTIANEIDAVMGIRLLDVHSDMDHNRSVITFVGPPAKVLEGAKAGVRAASRLIDLNRHSGAHPRLGAADVVPLVPVRGIGMEDIVPLARRLAKDIYEDLGIPTYLYGEAALTDARHRLEKVRLKGFEQLRELVATDESYRPDYGPASLHPTAGATIVGARKALIAFNVDLDSQDLEAARSIASAVRERDGGLRGVKALALRLESKGCVQVSTNITDTEMTTPYQLFRRIEHEAKSRGIDVRNGELVGLMPIEAVLRSAGQSVGLGPLAPDRIIELNL